MFDYLQQEDLEERFELNAVDPEQAVRKVEFEKNKSKIYKILDELSYDSPIRDFISLQLRHLYKYLEANPVDKDHSFNCWYIAKYLNYIIKKEIDEPIS